MKVMLRLTDFLRDPIVLYLSIAFVLVASFTSLYFQLKSTTHNRGIQVYGTNRRKSSELSARSRPAGKKWIPVDFKPDDPPPYPGWDINLTKPLPCHSNTDQITTSQWLVLLKDISTSLRDVVVFIGLRKGSFDEWVELDNEFLKFHGSSNRTVGNAVCVLGP
ncbi:hypothetical protein H072_5492 [Dactylellina haptotyla CBS 200.50]|uniref:Uncharacterized protein n=1 Tax=Dactylellina haptotyla (strain CBS 200.50) TaxID=1284197 RepID=S8BZ28_DACHA|nr:hypothetical protein H072_5492 [Dactylellina haptotyla CBS 200.50]